MEVEVVLAPAVVGMETGLTSQTLLGTFLFCEENKQRVRWMKKDTTTNRTRRGHCLEVFLESPTNKEGTVIQACTLKSRTEMLVDTELEQLDETEAAAANITKSGVGKVHLLGLVRGEGLDELELVKTIKLTAALNTKLK
jgi:hypothetical protein